ncbi:hypothetical protein Tco_1120466 [Tanacetum coccineum]
MLAPPVVEGEGSGQPSEPQPTPFTAQPRIKEQIPVTESSPTPYKRTLSYLRLVKLVQVTDPGAKKP